jgi:asparagine synthase (glutamine-hydrolysing)
LCGIAGEVRFDGHRASHARLEAMVKALAHRGPDGEGHYLRDQVAIGHRRLAIVDPTQGAQPVSTPDGEVVLAFNGEIYNHPQLRIELERAGLTFRTRSDAEVLLQAWLLWGEACLDRLRGMFAIAIVDWRQRCLILARDHFGIKPLYCAAGARSFAFASEIQALRGIPDLSFDVDPVALDQYLGFGYVPAPRTIFGSVTKLLPGNLLRLPLDGGAPRARRYWRIAFDGRDRRDAPQTDWEDEVEQCLRHSVRRHLIADVPYGAYLSGGIDSSLIVSMMTEAGALPVRTFSVGFEEGPYNELPFVANVEQRLPVRSSSIMLDHRAVELLPKLMRHHGEPFADPSSIATCALARHTGSQLRMVLSGDGGDEAFGGYPSHLKWIRRHRQAGPPPSASDWQRCMLGALFDSDERAALWRPEFSAYLNQPVESLETAFAEARDLEPIDQARYLDFALYLPNWILPKQDIASMMWGVEVRTPFVDVDVVSLVQRIPANWIIREVDGSMTGKYLLKRILARRFNADFVYRSKQGFVPPIMLWMDRASELRGTIRGALTRPGSHLRRFLEPDAIEATFRQNLRQAWDRLWALYCLEVWLQVEADDRSAGARTID